MSDIGFNPNSAMDWASQVVKKQSTVQKAITNTDNTKIKDEIKNIVQDGVISKDEITAFKSTHSSDPNLELFEQALTDLQSKLNDLKLNDKAVPVEKRMETGKQMLTALLGEIKTNTVADDKVVPKEKEVFCQTGKAWDACAEKGIAFKRNEIFYLTNKGELIDQNELNKRVQSATGSQQNKAAQDWIKANIGSNVFRFEGGKIPEGTKVENGKVMVPETVSGKKEEKSINAEIGTLKDEEFKPAVVPQKVVTPEGPVLPEVVVPDSKVELEKAENEIKMGDKMKAFGDSLGLDAFNDQNVENTVAILQMSAKDGSLPEIVGKLSKEQAGRAVKQLLKGDNPSEFNRTIAKVIFDQVATTDKTGATKTLEALGLSKEDFGKMNTVGTPAKFINPKDVGKFDVEVPNLVKAFGDGLDFFKNKECVLTLVRGFDDKSVESLKQLSPAQIKELINVLKEVGLPRDQVNTDVEKFCADLGKAFAKGGFDTGSILKELDADTQKKLLTSFVNNVDLKTPDVGQVATVLKTNVKPELFEGLGQELFKKAGNDALKLLPNLPPEFVKGMSDAFKQVEDKQIDEAVKKFIPKGFEDIVDHKSELKPGFPRKQLYDTAVSAAQEEIAKIKDGNKFTEGLAKLLPGLDISKLDFKEQAGVLLKGLDLKPVATIQLTDLAGKKPEVLLEVVKDLKADDSKLIDLGKLIAVKPETTKDTSVLASIVNKLGSDDTKLTDLAKILLDKPETFKALGSDEQLKLLTALAKTGTNDELLGALSKLPKEALPALCEQIKNVKIVPAKIEPPIGELKNKFDELKNIISKDSTKEIPANLSNSDKVDIITARFKHFTSEGQDAGKLESTLKFLEKSKPEIVNDVIGKLGGDVKSLNFVASQISGDSEKVRNLSTESQGKLLGSLLLEGGTEDVKKFVQSVNGNALNQFTDFFTGQDNKVFDKAFDIISDSHKFISPSLAPVLKGTGLEQFIAPQPPKEKSSSTFTIPNTEATPAANQEKAKAEAMKNLKTQLEGVEKGLSDKGLFETKFENGKAIVSFTRTTA